MDKIKTLEAEIGELASALNRMNENVTPETATTVKVANEVFGGTLERLQEELRIARLAHAKQTNLVI